MKIGIITWFSGGNYGTNLQAIALQRYLRSKGHSVRIVNFEVGAQRKTKRTFWQKVQGQPQKYATKYAQKKYREQIQRRYRKMKNEVANSCIFTDSVSCEQDYIDICNGFDLLICGSDQIWNPNWYHRFYYADYDEIKTRRISYAPSLGVNEIEEDHRDEIKRSLSHFSEVSVRERKGAELLKQLMPGNPAVVVDPTLLLDANAWNMIFPRNEVSDDRYVLSMFLTDNCAHWKAAGRFAKENRLKHVVIPYCGFSYFQKAEIHADADIHDFLNLIRGAEYVLTDSFHVSVFSLIYQKQFYTFERFQEDAFSSQNERVRNLLEMTKVGDRLIPYGAGRICNQGRIDYSIVEKALDSEVIQSKEFLTNAIGD